MDDTQQTQQPTGDPVMPSTDGISSMNDVAGMTPPPPAPVMPDPLSVVMPASSATVGGATVTDPMPTANKAPVAEGAENEYSYAEDVLNEILDALDRIEAKLEAMEKKMG